MFQIPIPMALKPSYQTAPECILEVSVTTNFYFDLNVVTIVLPSKAKKFYVTHSYQFFLIVE